MSIHKCKTIITFSILYLLGSNMNVLYWDLAKCAGKVLLVAGAWFQIGLGSPWGPGVAVGEGRGDDPPLPPPSQQLRFRSAEGVSCAPSFQKRVSSYTNTLYSVKVGVHLNAYTQTFIMHIDITIYIHIYEYTKTLINTVYTYIHLFTRLIYKYTNTESAKEKENWCQLHFWYKVQMRTGYITESDAIISIKILQFLKKL